MGAASHFRSQRWLADFAGRLTIRRVRAAAVPTGVRFLSESLQTGARVAGLELASLESLSGIRARKHRHVYLRTVVHRRIQESTRLDDTEKVDDSGDAGPQWAGCDGRGGSEPPAGL